MNKERCEKAAETISQYMFTSNEYTPSLNEALEALNLIDKLIVEHFDNPPLLFCEIVDECKGIPIWDNKLNEWCIVDNFNLTYKTINLTYREESVKRQFEDGRYFRKEVM